MVERVNFYVEQNTAQTHTGDTNFTAIPGMSISGGDLLANTKYLIIARGLYGGNNVSGNFSIRAATPDDSTIATKSEAKIEPVRVGADELVSWFFPHSFQTDASPGDVTLEFRTAASGQTVRADQLAMDLIDLDAIGVVRTDYFEHIVAAVGTEYSTTAATTLLAQLSGNELGTDKHWILGYARTDVGSPSRWFDVAIHAARDTPAAAERGKHRAEGEDIAEQRIVGFSIVHKASSGSPNVTLYGQEEDAAANMTHGGAYLIALPASLFADLEFDYQAAGIAANGETTIASVTFTPSVNGNHIVTGRSNVSIPAPGFVQTWVEDGTTEIRTGDSIPSHTQTWDLNKDEESALTFQRLSISAAITLNLQGDRNSATGGLEHRWLVVVNLSERQFYNFTLIRPRHFSTPRIPKVLPEDADTTLFLAQATLVGGDSHAFGVAVMYTSAGLVAPQSIVQALKQEAQRWVDAHPLVDPGTPPGPRGL